MSKLERLLEELCPNGVEYKTLAELGYFYNGLSGKKKEDFLDGNSKFITYMNVYSNMSLNINIDDKVRITKNEKQNIIQYGDILFTGSSESLNECGISSVLTTKTKEKLYLNSFCFGFRFFDENRMLADFSKYVFKSNEVRKQIIKTASGVTRFNVSKKKMKNVIIPVPPLPIQEEIVRILDSFTEKTNELKAQLEKELEARKKQYEWYIERLIINTKSDWIYLSELANFIYGYTAKSFEKGEARYIRISDINEQGKLKNYDIKYISLNEESKKSLLSKGDLIVVRTGATYGKTLYFENKYPSVYASFLIKIIPNKEFLNNKYYWYFTKSSLYWNQANKLVSKGGQPQFNTPALKHIKIPLPSLEEQQRIVDILDRFDKLCNDITEGLPAEIDARQKQYEYYRDKLLTFKKKEIINNG